MNVAAAARRHRRRRRATPIITRRNNPEPPHHGRRDWVRNGDIWTITAVGDDGQSPSHARLRHQHHHSATTEPSGLAGEGAGSAAASSLPASYVAEHVDLGCGHRLPRARHHDRHWHVLVRTDLTRETFYVAMSRGRHANHAYVTLDRADDHAQPQPGDDPHATARSVLYGVLPSTAAPNSPRTRPSWLSRTSGFYRSAHRRV